MEDKLDKADKAYQKIDSTELLLSRAEIFVVIGLIIEAMKEQRERLRADLEIVRAHRETVVREVTKVNERLQAEVAALKAVEGIK